MRGDIALPVGGLLAIDTPAFIYELEGNPTYAQVVRPVFVALQQGSMQGVTSVVTLMEVLVVPLQRQTAQMTENLEALLLNYPSLAVLDVTRPIARRAAALRTRHRLRPMDSLQVATALEAGAAAFLTNDRGLRRVDELPVLILDDYRAT